jgi:predicted transposase YdaD
MNLDMTRQQLFETVKKSEESMKVETMTIIDEFIQEGKELGIEIGQERGIEIGKEIGKEETISQKNKEFTINLLNTGDFDDERIALLVGVEVEFVLQVKAELAAQKIATDFDAPNQDN